MKKMNIRLDSITDVKEFNTMALRCKVDLDIKSDRYTIDAKSLMGIFSIDLTNTLTLVVHTDDESVFEEVKQIFDKYIVA